jgi:hypothetical protein
LLLSVHSGIASAIISGLPTTRPEPSDASAPMTWEIRLAHTPDRYQSLCRIRRRSGPVFNHYVAVLLQAGCLHPHSRSRLGSHKHRLFGGETHSPHHELPDMARFPPRPHNSRAGVSVRSKQQMTELVGYDATQNYWDLELGMVALGATHRILVIDSGENRMDGKTEDRVFVLLDGRSKYP